MKSKELEEFLTEIISLDLSNKNKKGAENLTPMVWGGAGVAKTAILKQVAKKLGLELIVVRLNTLSPVDVRGIPYADPEKEICKFFPPNFLPKDEFDEKGNLVLDENGNEKKYLIFFDEVNTAPPLTQSVCYEIAHERTMASHRLPKFTAVVMAGNRTKDRGVTHQMPQPLANRCIHMEVVADAKDFVNHHSEVDDSLHPYVGAFLSYSPLSVHKDLIEKYVVDEIPAFPSYRTWKALSDYFISLGENFDFTDVKKYKLNGFIGKQITEELSTFVSYQKDLPDLDSILIHDNKDFASENRGVQYYLIYSLFLRLEQYKNTKKFSDGEIKSMFRNYIKAVVRVTDQTEIKAFGISLVRNSKNNLFYYTDLESNNELFKIVNKIMKD